ncbi:MAG: bifunctional [glutamine synthetase] adenylyltransferase/[glutamine synthetase]-adenylyl-L-tyrosine phosphorylase [Kineosporiaceae bacterium]
MRARVARAGFVDTGRALARLAALGDAVDAGCLVEALAGSADPDAALLAVERLVETGDGPVLALLAGRAAVPGGPGEPGARDAVLRRRDRLTRIAGGSRALADHLVRHPEDLPALDSGLGLTAEDRRRALMAAVAGRTGPAADDALKRAYRRQLLGIAADDLTADDPAAVLDAVTAALSDLAVAALEGALDIARREVPGGDAVRLAVVALGKTGACELNYISDVDVLYVAEPIAQPTGRPASPPTPPPAAVAPAPPSSGPGTRETADLSVATRIASRLQQVCGGATSEGHLWQVDAGLRPEGRNGPLVRTLAGHEAYYRRWAKPWEFQAMLKARHAAGDPELTRRWQAVVDPLVWAAAEREGFVDAARAMRRRVVDHIPAREADRQLKLGRGGLRDVEFAVQLLQLVHGRTDPRVRARATLPALEALITFGYVGRDDGADLDRAYRFLRVLEHRLQLHRLSRTHVLPTQDDAWRRLARAALGAGASSDDLRREWREHRLVVARLHEKLFYRPLLGAVARLTSEEVRLTPEAARARLQALGYSDPDGALRHLAALTAGVSRRAAIQRQLLPVMLGYFADGADPDAGLLAFRRISDSLGNTHWYLGMLRDAAGAAERFAAVLASGRLVPDLLTAAPDTALLLGGEDRLAPPPADGLLAEALAVADRAGTAADAVRAARGLHRRETVRTAIADITRGLPAADVGRSLATSATVGLEVALRAVARSWLAETGTAEPPGLDEALEALPTRMLVVGFGSVAAEESGYGSDVDVVAVHEPRPGADPVLAAECARDVVARARTLLRHPGAEPAIPVDPALRPEGRSGELVRTLDALESYYGRWSQPWEHQALLRARPLVGPDDLAERFLALVDPLRYPPGGPPPGVVAEIRRVKARVEAERLPRGADPRRHVKLGRGGTSDVEWTVQLLQLQHAHEVAALRTPSTRAALAAARDHGLLAADDAHRLHAAWRLGSRLRDAMVLWRGRPVDVLPVDRRDLDGIARLVGFRPGSATALEDEWLRVARRARGVVERVFFGWV